MTIDELAGDQSMVRKFDDWIFDNKWTGVQTNADRIQMHTNKDCFYVGGVLGEISVIVGMIFHLFLIMNTNSPGFKFFFGFMILFSLLWLTVNTLFSNKIKPRIKEGFQNPARLQDLWVRFTLWGVVFFWPVFWWNIVPGVIAEVQIDEFYTLFFIWLVLTRPSNIASAYFLACTPLPPKKLQEKRNEKAMGKLSSAHS